MLSAGSFRGPHAASRGQRRALAGLGTLCQSRALGRSAGPRNTAHGARAVPGGKKATLLLMGANGPIIGEVPPPIGAAREHFLGRAGLSHGAARVNDGTAGLSCGLSKLSRGAVKLSRGVAKLIRPTACLVQNSSRLVVARLTLAVPSLTPGAPRMRLSFDPIHFPISHRSPKNPASTTLPGQREDGGVSTSTTAQSGSLGTWRALFR